jgi:hypothetical protein
MRLIAPEPEARHNRTNDFGFPTRRGDLPVALLTATLLLTIFNNTQNPVEMLQLPSRMKKYDAKAFPTDEVRCLIASS